MRKLSVGKLVLSLLISFGATTAYKLSADSGGITGTCDNTKALKIVYQNSCAVFGPGGSGTSADYQVAIVTNYALSGCIDSGTSATSNNKQTQISQVQITETENDDGTLTTLTSALDLANLSAFNHSTVTGDDLIASGAKSYDVTTAAGRNECGSTAGEIHVPIHQMTDGTEAAETSGEAFASNFGDEHHGGANYVFKCTWNGSHCGWASAHATGTKFIAIQRSAANTFPASQLALVSAVDIDPSKLPGDTATFVITLTSTATSDTSAEALTYDGQANPVAH